MKTARAEASGGGRRPPADSFGSEEGASAETGGGAGTGETADGSCAMRGLVFGGVAPRGLSADGVTWDVAAGGSTGGGVGGTEAATGIGAAGAFPDGRSAEDLVRGAAGTVG